MRNFLDTFETCKRSFISAFSICMTVPLKILFPAQDPDMYLKKLLKCRFTCEKLKDCIYYYETGQFPHISKKDEPTCKENYRPESIF